MTRERGSRLVWGTWLTVRESHKLGPPLEPGPLALPLPKEAQEEGGRKGGDPGSKGGRGPG